MTIGDKLLEKTANIRVREDLIASRSGDIKTSPGRLLNMQEKISEAEEKVSLLKEKVGKAIEVDIHKIVEVSGRRRKLTEEQFQELKNNLLKNPLVSPVTVIQREDKQFELISGHNRVQAYRELGKTTIPAIIRELKDNETDLAAFYSNLLSPSLPDLEKYLGFKRIKEATGMDQAKLAKEAGISEPQVSRLFSYERLPSEALELLLNAPDWGRLGANAADEMVRVGKGKERLIVSAIRRLLDTPGFTQKQAISMITRSENTTIEKRKKLLIRKGKTTFCSIENRNNVLAIRFIDENTASEWQSTILKLIEDELTKQEYE